MLIAKLCINFMIGQAIFAGTASFIRPWYCKSKREVQEKLVDFSQTLQQELYLQKLKLEVL